jgi:hypothetical protein
MLIGYMHATTGEQSLDLQRDALARFGCERINMLGRYAFTLAEAVAWGELKPRRDPRTSGPGEP